MAVLPMFPLGSVLFPGVYLPLHVFEPRYREMVRACLDGKRAFGVALIERGSEVGGNDVRTDVGTIAEIVEAVELEDGRWALGCVGTRRIRIVSWLPDDPYPRAEVRVWDDTPAAEDLGERYAKVVGTLRRVLALATEVGDDAAPATTELTDDPAVGSFHVAAIAPFGPADRQRLLVAPGPAERLAIASGLLAEVARDLERRLALG